MQMSVNQPTEDRDVFTRRESEARSYCRSFNAIFKSAKGSIITAEDGRDYIDFLAGCASLNYGHNDPDLKAALIEHIASDGLTHALDLHTDVKRRFLESYENLVLKPRGLDYKVQFTGPTGANAVEAALKLARKVTGRRTTIAFTNGFHGVSMGALACTGNKYNRMAASNALNDVYRAPFEGYHGEGVDTIAMLAKLLDDPSSGVDAPAAFIVEPIQGEGGLNAASAEWLRRLADLAKVHGAMLIIDDIQAGCGRSGDFFGFEHAGIKPDMVTQAKSISGFGLPMALLLIDPEHDHWLPAEHNGTFRGNTHAFVTAEAAIRKFWADDAFAGEVKRKGELVRNRLAAIGRTVHGAKIVGRGMMNGLDVVSGELAGAICRRSFEKGLIVETSGNRDQVVKILAPLTTPVEQLEKGLAIIAEAAEECVADAQAQSASSSQSQNDRAVA